MKRNSLGSEMPQSPGDVLAYPIRGACYLNLTNRCTLRCRFCPKFNHRWDVHAYSLRLHREPDARDLIEAVGEPDTWREIVFCGLGEPGLRLDVILETARALKSRGNTPLRLNTDGLINRVHGRDVTGELAGLIDAVSISLNAQDERLYQCHCRPPGEGAYADMLDFARRARDRLPSVTLTAIDGLAGVDIEACADIARGLGVDFRPRVLDVVG